MKNYKWFNEKLYDSNLDVGYMQSFMAIKNIDLLQSEYQLIEVFENPKFGKVLALDGVIQTTETDEFFYHEMFVHVPMFYMNKAKNVLVIGGGDGGIIRELVKHKNLEKIVMVEIDEKVFEIAKKHMPNLVANADKDVRVKILFEDGIAYVKKTKEKFDVVLVDSTDPVSVAEGLFTMDFYRNVNKILNKDGIVVTQSGVPFYQPEEAASVYNKLFAIFENVNFFVVPVPSYVGGFMVLSFASNFDYVNKVDKKTINFSFEEKKIKNLKYYNQEIHFSAFKLPEYIKNIIS